MGTSSVHLGTTPLASPRPRSTVPQDHGAQRPTLRLPLVALPSKCRPFLRALVSSQLGGEELTPPFPFQLDGQTLLYLRSGYSSPFKHGDRRYYQLLVNNARSRNPNRSSNQLSCTGCSSSDANESHIAPHHSSHSHPSIGAFETWPEDSCDDIGCTSSIYGWDLGARASGSGHRSLHEQQVLVHVQLRFRSKHAERQQQLHDHPDGDRYVWVQRDEVSGIERWVGTTRRPI